MAMKYGEPREENKSHANLEIVGGLKRAYERGEELKDSMMSFYRAGYKKEEIEDAARAFLEEKEKMKKVAGALITNPNMKLKSKDGKLGPQRISEYGKKKEEEGKIDRTTLILIGILVLLFLMLGAIFLFKSEVVEFFNNLFG